jgi:hypothetical protein
VCIIAFCSSGGRRPERAMIRGGILVGMAKVESHTTLDPLTAWKTRSASIIQKGPGGGKQLEIPIGSVSRACPGVHVLSVNDGAYG